MLSYTFTNYETIRTFGIDYETIRRFGINYETINTFDINFRIRKNKQKHPEEVKRSINNKWRSV